MRLRSAQCNNLISQTGLRDNVVTQRVELLVADHTANKHGTLSRRRRHSDSLARHLIQNRWAQLIVEHGVKDTTQHRLFTRFHTPQSPGRTRVCVQTRTAPRVESRRNMQSLGARHTTINAAV